jgi:prephenate dehydrogenase
LNVTIIGLGLVGGSLGLALKAAQGHVTVAGWDQSPATVKQAHELGAIERIALSLPEAVHDADIVIVATPVLAVHTIFKEIASHLKQGAIVTDVASTKAQVVAWAQDLLPPTVTFVGGHPMAGSEQHGIANARADLVRGAVYCLTPLPSTPSDILAKLESLIISIGARPLRIPAATHDAYVAAVSHVPFLLSTALVQLTTSDEHWPSMRQVAATGYRDMTRLASGDPAMHCDICLTNAEAIRPWLYTMAQLLEELAGHLDDPAYLHALFDTARQRREDWLREP